MKINPLVARKYILTQLESAEAGGDEIKLKYCPECGDDKWRTFFNVQMQISYCHRHEHVVNLFDIVKAREGFTTIKEVWNYLSEFGELGLSTEQPSGDWKTAAFAKLREAMATKFRVPTVLNTVPDFTTHWDACDAGRRIFAYANQRNLPPWFLHSGRVGYCHRGSSMAGRLVFLVLQDGKPVYYFGRSILKSVVPKYLYPAESVWGCGMGDVVFNLDLCSPGRPIIVCEGGISAVSAGEGAVATLGKRVSHRQAKLIAAKNPSEVVVLRERGVDKADCYASAERIAGLGVPTSVADLINGDANDDPDQMPEVLASADPVGPLASLRARLHGKF